MRVTLTIDLDDRAIPSAKERVYHAVASWLAASYTDGQALGAREFAMQDRQYPHIAPATSRVELRVAHDPRPTDHAAIAAAEHAAWMRAQKAKIEEIEAMCTPLTETDFSSTVGSSTLTSRSMHDAS